MPPLNSECHAGASEVFAALSTGGKSLRPVREIQAGDSSRLKRVGASAKLDLELIRRMQPPGYPETVKARVDG